MLPEIFVREDWMSDDLPQSDGSLCDVVFYTLEVGS